jgi:hypothetical protein
VARLARDGVRTDRTVSLLVRDVLHTPGVPLSPAVRATFEPRFGRDFSQVRVHSDDQAAAAAASVAARAFTVGRHIVFGAGEYAPHRPDGTHLLAHELTHVLQQDHAADLPSERLELAPEGDRAEREAQAVADRFMHGLSSSGQSITDPVASVVSPPAVQREDDDRRSPSPTPTPDPTPASTVKPPDSGTCGPDVKKQIVAAIKMARHTFNDIWTPSDREEACMAIVKKKTAAIAWDIPELHHQEWIADYRPECATWTSYPRCGWFTTDPDFNKDRQIAGTVTVDNSCHLAGSANYVIFGVMMKLCHDEYDDRVTQAQTRMYDLPWWERARPGFDLQELKNMESVFTEGHMRTLIWAYKGHIWFIRDASGNYEAAKRWASAGYNGWPTGESTPEADRAKCAVPCPLAYGSRGAQTGDFHVNWYPHGWSSSPALGP